ncbi:DUF2267 domain-containing protein [Vulgatibacter incomptus]|uniref:CBS domain pair protein n=1 Tax=Vulgatibacter incomptus TaxID=1391653 RepID=A0A0K1PG99_9BACT|nr:DUF2267 domain-containing protein [Vulgatibacter incomptus]AKU92532.1 CBS domain pair protein [Vulgatibacter incomptus]
MADETPDVSATPVPTRHEPADDYRAFVDELRWTHPIEDPEDAAYAAAVVLCQLERRLTGERRDELAFRLPEEFQILLAACPRVDGSGAQRTNARTFLADVADLLGTEPTATFQIVSAVFTALRDRLPDEDVHWVASQLPPDLADIWRRPV